MVIVTDHPQRYGLANELHARPSPVLSAPATAAFLAMKMPKSAAPQDHQNARDHLIALLDRFGAPHPRSEDNHYFGTLGRHHLKWEKHNEFVTYTVFSEGVTARAFDPAAFDVFPEDWLKDAPGARITSAHIRIDLLTDTAENCAKDIEQTITNWFVGESLAATWVLDRAAMVAGDFRIDPSGHMRFAVFVAQNTGSQRIGRIVQRLCEIETYKSMSILGLPLARDLQQKMSQIDDELTVLVGAMSREQDAPEVVLDDLLTVSSRLEDMSASASFRLSATQAYESIVHQRIDVLREERFFGRQTFSEFMMRRYDPAMRTVKTTQDQLLNTSERAMRAGELLRTRVDVQRSKQNQALLESMDRRADLQLRLQETVEGLSVVAISYYAVSLASYLAYPLVEVLGVSKGMLSAGLTLPVVVLVWLFLRRMRREISA
jgi:uncharacterized membrane-anchored protein